MLAVLWMGICTALLSPARAAPTLRFLVDEHGDFLVFGNSAAQDCRTGIPAPVVGTIGACGANSEDSAPDVLWRSEDTTAAASTAITVDSGRSSAVLKLPAGAVVLYARLYWAAQVPSGTAPRTTVSFERPGVFAKTLGADNVRGTASVDNGLNYYQSNADVTADIQAFGSGVYRVGNIDTLSLVDLNQSVDFVAWSVVVLYRLDSEPTRNLAIFDGLDRVAGGAPATATLSGFLVPSAGFDAKLGAITYEGDYDLTGDSMIFNGTSLSNALNPANNFFNGTRSYLGTAVSTPGDLPQLTGNPGSMSSFDLDVVDVTGQVKAGDTKATIQGTSSGDVYFLGTFITSIATLKPVFSDTNKTWSNLTRVGGKTIPGDVIEYTITTRNTGSDTGVGVVLTDTLPGVLTYLPGSLVVTTGANAGAKTDAAGDDQAEYDAGSRTITVRLGAGATATAGGTVKVGDAVTTIKFRATVNAGTIGVIQNQATVSSQGQIAVSQGLTTPGSWLSGDGSNPNVPTIFSVDQCAANANCPVTAPICSSGPPAQCVCQKDADCQAGLLCDVGGSNRCVQCTAGNTTNCSAGGAGSQCLMNACGCNTDADCGGRTCNTTTHQCPPIVNTDLAVLVTPPATPVAAGGVAIYTVIVVNNGPGGAVTSADLSDVLPPGVSGVTWVCAGTAGAVCPAALGTGSIGSGGLVSLPVNGRLSYTVSIPVPVSAAGGTLDYTATGTLPIGYTDPNPNNNTSTGSATVNPATDLVLTVMSAAQAQDGSVTHTLSVRNAGPATTPAESLTYQIPDDVQVVSVMSGTEWSCLNVSATVTCTRTMPLTAGSTAAPVVIRVLPPVTATTLAVVAAAQGMDEQLRSLADTMPANNRVSTTVPVTGPDLALTVLAGPEAPDGTVTHVLQVTNNGPGTAPGQQVDYDIPAQYTIESLRLGLGWECTTSTGASGGPHVSCVLATPLPPAMSAPPIRIVVKPPLGSTMLPVTAVVTGLSGALLPLTNDPVPANNTVTSATMVSPGPDLSLLVTTQPQAADGSVKYTLTLSNAGPGSAPGATVNYDLPAGARLGSFQPGAGWTCVTMTRSDNGTELACTRSVTVPIGDAPPIVLTVFPPYGADTLSTVGNVIGFDGMGRPLIDPVPANNEVKTDTAVVTGPDLRLTVTADLQGRDGSLAITLQVDNLGEGVAPGASVSYQIPDGATVRSIEPGEGWACTSSTHEGEQGVITCVRNVAIPIGSAPPIRIVLLPPATGGTLPTRAFVQGVDGSGRLLFDPDESNNSVDETTPLAMFRLAGGGCACSVPGGRHGAEPGGLLVAAGLTLGSLLLGLRRRRRLMGARARA